MSAVFEDITATVGYTPLVKLNKIVDGQAEVLVKLESKNPSSSVKDRIALSMIETAEAKGLIDKDTVIIEPTSGNTGIGLAFVCAAKGYQLILAMPESMSLERRKLLMLFGAQIALTPASEGMTGAVNKAEELMKKYQKSFMPQQFKNPSNPKIHYETTAREIWTDSDKAVDILVSGVGTGGTITGCGQYLKSKKKDLQVVAVEPSDSPVLSGGNPGPHKIQGIGAGFVPDVLKRDLIDEVIKVTNEDALETAKQLAKREGILSGISGGANVWAALEVAKRKENKGRTIVTFICDTGERYISTELYDGLSSFIQ